MTADLPRQESLADNDVRVWYCLTGELDAAALARLERSLDADERARRERFVFARDRRDFGAAHGLLRRALSAYGDEPPEAWRFERSTFGKPSIVATQCGVPPLVFNLSHTDGLVACAVARGLDVGVDVERIANNATVDELASSYFARLEVEQLQACCADERGARFTEVWTLKESYLKAVGLGLSRPLSSFAFEFEDQERVRFHPLSDAEDGRWHFALFAPSDAHRLAVAAAAPVGRRCRVVTRCESTALATAPLLRGSTP